MRKQIYDLQIKAILGILEAQYTTIKALEYRIQILEKQLKQQTNG